MPKVIKVGKKAELDGLIRNFETVLVDFSAPAWCIPCKRLAPHFEAAAEKLAGVAILVEIDVDTADRDLVESFSVQSVPTVKVFKNGSFVKDSDARTAIQLIAEARS